MNPYDYLMHHLQFAQSRHFQYLISIDKGVLLAISGWIESPSWNHAVIQTPEKLDEIMLKKIEKISELSGRRPALYLIEPLTPEVEKLLAISDFQLFDTEYWMISNSRASINNTLCDVNMLPVQTENDIYNFLRAFKVAFSALEIGYSYQLHLSLLNQGVSLSKAHHIYAEINGQPCGIGSCYHDSKYAGLYNLAVCPKYQMQGIGRKMVGCLLEYLHTHECENVFLQADNSSKGFYENLGFYHCFSGEIYVKM